jgi:hypothetical protein
MSFSLGQIAKHRAEMERLTFFTLKCFEML